MANNVSAVKRIKIGARNASENSRYRTSVKNQIKNFEEAVKAYNNAPNQEDKENLKKMLSLLYSSIDKAVKKNVIHRNNGAKKKAKFSAKLKLIS